MVGGSNSARKRTSQNRNNEPTSIERSQTRKKVLQRSDPSKRLHSPKLDQEQAEARIYRKRTYNQVEGHPSNRPEPSKRVRYQLVQRRTGSTSGDIRLRTQQKAGNAREFKNNSVKENQHVDESHNERQRLSIPAIDLSQNEEEHDDYFYNDDKSDRHHDNDKEESQERDIVQLQALDDEYGPNDYHSSESEGDQVQYVSSTSTQVEEGDEENATNDQPVNVEPDCGAKTDADYHVDIEKLHSKEHAMKGFEDSSDIEGEFDPLLEALISQKERMRNDPKRLRAVYASRTASRSTKRNLKDNVLTIKQAWELEKESKDHDFFTGKVAKLQIPLKIHITANGRKRCEAFKGVSLNEFNNSDVKYVHDNQFGGLVNSCTGPEAYYHFKIVMGQFARVAIAMERVDPFEICQPGELFQLAQNRSLFQAFLGHFVAKGSDGSVKNKAQHLFTMVNQAREYFGEYPMFGDDQRRNNNMDQKIKRTAAYCLRMSAVHKKLQRTQKSITKEKKHKIAVNKLITERDFEDFRTEAKTSLAGILDSMKKRFEEKHATDRPTKRNVFYDYVEGKKAFLSKWTINILALMVLYGNGQRNQVYRMLRAPSLTELDAFHENSGGQEAKVPLTFDLVADENEKIPRDVKIPFIMFDPRIFPFVYFHVEFVRPYLLKIAAAKDNVKSKAFLLDTRHGTPLTSDNIRFTISSFVKNINPELHITVADVRACYATYIIRRYFEKGNDEENETDCFTSLDESSFFEMLSAVMNTSTDMLRNVYAAASFTSYADHVAKVLEVVK